MLVDFDEIIQYLGVTAVQPFYESLALLLHRIPEPGNHCVHQREIRAGVGKRLQKLGDEGRPPRPPPGLNCAYGPNPHPERCRGLLAAILGVSQYQGYAKNAYPWLISWHRSAVPTRLFFNNTPVL